MKTILRASDRVSLYMLGDETGLRVSEAGISIGSGDQASFVSDLNSATALIVEVVAVPQDWSGGRFRLGADGVWVDLTDEHAAQQQAVRVAAIMESIVSATQARLDDFAKTRNYDGIISACTYAASQVQKFAAEGQYCISARDLTWAALYMVMKEVETGIRQMPASFADIEPVLPALVWPA